MSTYTTAAHAKVDLLKSIGGALRLDPLDLQQIQTLFDAGLCKSRPNHLIAACRIPSYNWLYYC